ncbi:MAG: protein kinase [Sorangium cellulosum]|nr:MAG: protein kinase [Sorangium cellulosum]
MEHKAESPERRNVAQDAVACYGRFAIAREVMHVSSESTSDPVPMLCPRCREVYGPGKTFCPVDGARLTDRLEPDALDDNPHVPCSSVIADRYELGALIGQGSMARVYAARDLWTQCDVAVKILSHRYAESENERRRFFREAGAAIQINHENVVKVLDVGRRVDGRPFIVIEYLHGESFGECLRRRKRVELDVALPLLLDAARGLSAVHAAGIVHRDVKPDNIFLLGEPDAPQGVRLVDFGLAKLHGNGTKNAQAGTSLGTAAYMPPEQVLSEAVDARADIYSMGVVMFRALTGHLPFESEKDLDMLAHQVLLQAPPPSWFLEGLDPRVDSVVTRAMCKRPENRYATMKEFAEDLDRLNRDKSLDVRASSERARTDVYRPTSDLGREATLLFCKRLGMPPPSWE